jgi:hypothetical protein
MRFRNIFSHDEAYPEGRYIVLEHQTPAYLWQPRYMAHPNGAVGLEAALICASDVPAQRARLETIAGRPLLQGTDGVLRYSAPGGGTLELHGAEAFEQRFGWRPTETPRFAGVEVSFASRDAAAGLMVDNGIPVERRGDEWFVGPAHTNGFILRLRP